MIDQAAWDKAKQVVAPKTKKPRGPKKPLPTYEVIGRPKGSSNDFVIGEIKCRNDGQASRAARIVAALKGMQLVCVRPAN